MKYSNWSKITLLTIVFILFNFTTIAQNQNASNQKWKLIKAKKKGDGWKLYKRKVTGTKLYEIKIAGKINSSMKKAQNSSMKLFVDSSVYIKKGKSTGWFKIFKQTKDEIELYSYMKGNFLTKDRDVLVRYNTYEDTANNALGVKWHEMDKAGYEPKHKVIRMPVDQGDWLFKEIDSNSCMATMIFHFDPGGNPPAWMINMITKSFAPHEFNHLKKLCEKE